MNFRIQTGKGITGALRYVQGEGRDPKTGKLIELAPGAEGRAKLLGGTGFGFEVTSEAHAELARKMMEHLAQNQASKTKKCEQDCVHIELSWARGETPSREEAIAACRSALAAQGMSNAMALFYSHHDEDYFHTHIVASKINPETRRAYDLAGSWRKGSAWAEQWEREHGGVINTRRETANELRRAIRARDVDGVLEAITKQRSTFTPAELQRAVNKEIFPKIGATAAVRHIAELERAQFINTVLSHPEIVQLAEKQGGPTVRYTTRTVLEAEMHVLRAANGLKADTGHGVGEDLRFATLKAPKYDGISREQVHAFRHCTGDEGLALIDGQAGTGKSFTMAAIRDAYEAAGHRVIGLAPTNKVAKNLAAGGFQHAKTVHSELFALNNGRTSWDAKTVLMVDEAAMLDTKLMAMVTAHAHDAGAKILLVGDDRQLSSIDRGGMFSVLKDRHGAATLTEVRRQHKIDERRASEMLAEGNFDGALGIYEQKGSINWALTQKDARAGLVAKWAHDTATDRGKSRLVLAYTNDAVNELNTALRTVRKERGELEWEDHTIKTAHGAFEFSAGDRIRFTGTDRKMGVENNATGTIETIDGTHLAVRLDGPEGKTINFDATSFDHFRHSYAGTIYAGQGSTYDSVYLYHSEHWRSSPAYVALTRHKEKTELFVARNTAKDLKELARQVSRSDETRAASMFYQQRPIDPVRPMNAAEILAHFAGEGIGRAAERMERERTLGQPRTADRMSDANSRAHDPKIHRPVPRPKPPWPSLRERRQGYRLGAANENAVGMTVDLIRRDPWKAVALALPADASRELLAFVAATARGFASTFSEWAEEAVDQRRQSLLGAVVQAKDRQLEAESRLEALIKIDRPDAPPEQLAAQRRFLVTTASSPPPPPPLTLEAIESEPWTAVFHSLPDDASRELLIAARVAAAACAREARSEIDGHDREDPTHAGHAEDMESAEEKALHRINEIDGRLQALEYTVAVPPRSQRQSAEHLKESDGAPQPDETRYRPTPRATAEFREAGRETNIPGGARMEAAWQQPAFSFETIDADPWTAVFLPIPEQADRQLLKSARLLARHFQSELEGDEYELLAGNSEFRDPGPFRNPGTYNRDDKIAAATKRLVELDRILFAAELSTELSPDELAERVQQIIDDPSREQDEYDPRVLQALYARREAEAPPAAAAEDVREVEQTSDIDEETGTNEEEKAIDSAVSGQEMTDDKQVQYSRATSQLFGAAGRQTTRPSPGGRGRTRSR